MAAPGAWFVFGFEGADEPPRGPDTGTAAPRALPLPPGGVRVLRPGWDCVVIVTGERAPVPPPPPFLGLGLRRDRPR